MKKYDINILGINVRKKRESHQWTRETLAERVDSSPEHIRNIENNKAHCSLGLFLKLVEILETRYI